MKNKNNLLKQYHVKNIGAFIDVIYLTMPLFSLVAAVMTAITMYTVIQPWLRVAFPWMRLWIFFSMMAMAACVLMLLMFKFVYPSYFAFRNKQEYAHKNLIREDLEAIKKKLGIE